MENQKEKHSNHIKKKHRKEQTLESQFRFNLDICIKHKDLSGAIALYDAAISQNLRFNNGHFNSLLYLCSNFVRDPSSPSATLETSNHLAIEYGFRVFRHMLSCNVNPNESTIASVARLAAAKGDGDFAFKLVSTMGQYKIEPKRRSYVPALFTFCKNLEAEKAYSVEDHMTTVGICPDEPELAALLKVSLETGREDRVYSYLHKLGSSMGCVSESTGEIIENWFLSTVAIGVCGSKLDPSWIREAILKNGGGSHGLGWIGNGKWLISRTRVGSTGCCYSCNEQLACVDIDRSETEKFAESIASLAKEREADSKFSEFQNWLESHAHYEAIVDGANIGLYQQNFEDGTFSLPQLKAVVQELYTRNQKKWPLVVLHNKRYWKLWENPSNRELLEAWVAQDMLYTTPYGSNDDWYWLYAAVKLKCLLVTNDEMRDHIYELLGSSFFRKWKERHQVHYTFVKDNLQLQMPRSFSLVIQESEKGSWHVPLAAGETTIDESSRTWICITRLGSCRTDCDEIEVKMDKSSVTGETLHWLDEKLVNHCTSESLKSANKLDRDLDIFPTDDNKSTARNGKRKDLSVSPSRPFPLPC